MHRGHRGRRAGHAEDQLRRPGLQGLSGRLARRRPRPSGRAGCRPTTSTPTGPEASSDPRRPSRLGKLFSKLDDQLPRPSTWVNGPGGVQPDARPWDEVQKDTPSSTTMAALGRQGPRRGQSGTFRLLAQPVPVPPGRRPGELHLGPIQRGDQASQGGEGPPSVRSSLPGTWPCRFARSWSPRLPS